MNEALEKLKGIGSQKIYEDTHIPTEHIQSILYENFEGLSRLQFLGFISIIEREYGYNLDELRSRGTAYFDEIEANKDVVINESIYKAPSKKKNFMFFYALVAVVIFIIAVSLTISSSNENEIDETTFNDTIIKDVQKNIIDETNKTKIEKNLQTIADINETNTIQIVPDVNRTTNNENKEEESQATVNETFEIIPRKRVWLGYIDLTDKKRYQKTFSTKLSLDPKKEWLLFFGHGNINIATDGNMKKFNNRDVLRVHYKNGEFKKITPAEFKRLNGGKKW